MSLTVKDQLNSNSVITVNKLYSPSPVRLVQGESETANKLHTFIKPTHTVNFIYRLKTTRKYVLLNLYNVYLWLALYIEEILAEKITSLNIC